MDESPDDTRTHLAAVHAQNQADIAHDLALFRDALSRASEAPKEPDQIAQRIIARMLGPSRARTVVHGDAGFPVPDGGMARRELSNIDMGI